MYEAAAGQFACYVSSGLPAVMLNGRRIGIYLRRAGRR